MNRDLHVNVYVGFLLMIFRFKFRRHALSFLARSSLRMALTVSMEMDEALFDVVNLDGIRVSKLDQNFRLSKVGLFPCGAQALVRKLLLCMSRKRQFPVHHRH